MDCQDVVAVNDQSDYSALLEEAVLLVRQVLKIECPLIHSNCLKTEVKVDLYLLPFFEGETYELVSKLGVPIIGPAAIIYLLKHEVLLPRRLKKGQHMYSVALQKTRVCCSNIDKETREKLYEQVIAMGGNVSTTLTSDVTHLVVDEVGSLKYQCAVKLGIPIMSPSWISHLWDKSKSQVTENDKPIMDEYKCLPFRGCTICVTGLDAALRSDIQHLTTKHGGTYSGDLVMEKCTHLILDLVSGNKFEHACKWKIPCVRSTWFYESIKKGVCLDLTEFLHVTEAPFRDVSYRPVLEETRDCTSRSDTTADRSVVNQLSALDLDITLNKNKGYLEGCRIYLSGFTSTEQDQIKKIINHGGGMRLDVLSERVTHIVTKTNTFKEIDQLNSMQPEAAIVSVDWLTKSMQLGTQQPEDNYNLLPTLATPTNPLPNIKSSQSNKQDTGQSILDHYRSDTTLQGVDTALQGVDTTDNNVTSNVTMTTSNVSVSTTHISTSDTTGLINRTKAQDSSILQKSDLFKGFKFTISPNVLPKIARNVQQQIISHGGCIRGRYMEVTPWFCTAEPWRNLHIPLIVTCHPEARQDKPEFYVGDPFKRQDSANSQYSNCTYVTYMWLQRCIQSAEILSVTDSILYTPHPVPASCTVLQDCVVCYTQISGFELAHVCKAVESLGGTCQGTFTNKAIKVTDTMPECQPCTHLLYKRYEADSKKISAAFKWKLPCVHVDWLHKCLETLSLADTQTYLYDSTPPGKRDKLQAEKTQAEKLCNAAQKVSKEMPENSPAVTITRSGSVLKHDNDGFVTPMKMKPKSTIKVDAVLAALESPAPLLDTTASSLDTIYKRNITAALKKTAPPSKILNGVTLVVKQNKNIEVPALEVKAAARRNGAVVRTYIDRACTHVICSLKELRESNIERAVKQGVKAVSCYWVTACDEAKIRLLEADFPPGFDPKRSLNISVSEDVEVSAVDIDNTQTIQPLPADDPHSLDANLLKEINMLEKIGSSDEVSSGFVAPGTPRSRGKRSTFRKIERIDCPVEDLMSQAHPTVAYEDGQATREAIFAREENPSKETAAPLDGREPPDDTLNNSNIPNVSLAPTSSSTPNRSSAKEPHKLSESEVRALVNDINPSDLDLSDPVLDKPPAERYFLFTGMNDSEKKEFGGIISNLNGTLLSSSSFDSKCTHLIATKPNRNEKYISGVGCGVWVLHPTFLTSSQQLGAWAEEKQFTWNNFSHGLKGITKNLAESSCRWFGRKAFTGWNVMLCISANKTKNIKGVIESGGGRVSQEQPPYKALTGLTHALVETTMNPKPDVPVAALVEAGVHCLKLEYIPEFLIHGPDSAVLELHVIPQAKDATSSNKRSVPDTSLTSTPSKRYKI